MTARSLPPRRRPRSGGRRRSTRTPPRAAAPRRACAGRRSARPQQRMAVRAQVEAGAQHDAVDLARRAVVEHEPHCAVAHGDADATTRPSVSSVLAVRGTSQDEAAGRMQRYAIRSPSRVGTRLNAFGLATSQLSPTGPTSVGGYSIRRRAPSRACSQPLRRSQRIGPRGRSPRRRRRPRRSARPARSRSARSRSPRCAGRRTRPAPAAPSRAPAAARGARTAGPPTKPDGPVAITTRRCAAAPRRRGARRTLRRPLDARGAALVHAGTA